MNDLPYGCQLFHKILIAYSIFLINQFPARKKNLKHNEKYEIADKPLLEILITTNQMEECKEEKGVIRSF